MSAAVMGFLVVVSGLASGAAWLGEAGLRRLGAPARWVWVAALAAGPALLVAGTVPLPDGRSLVGGAGGPLAVVELPALTVGSAGGAAGLPTWLAPTLWMASTVAFLALLVRARLRLGREAAGWRTERALGRAVFVSRALGPAVAGLLRPRIVVPQWALGLPERQLRLILAHEEEHVRAGDTWLLGVALALLGTAAWNPLTWWQMRRLRLAIEMDCDRRVLGREGDLRSYGESLLTVAARAGRPSLALAGFTEDPRSLERRIRAMTARVSRRTRWAGCGLVAAAVLLAAQACGVDSPVTASDEDGAPPVMTQVPPELADEPVFTPFTTAPEILNREEVIRAMEEAYPPLLRDAGIGGTIRVYFLIDSAGRVADIRIDQSSGQAPLDQAALSVARVYRFAPALNRDEPVPVWVSFPITFQVR